MWWPSWCRRARRGCTGRSCSPTAAWSDRAMSDEAFDVIVVGGGGAGLAAAIEAAESQARVLLLERNQQLGGSTAWSIGS
ncbi:MAG: FAD-dependent oxidoreductase, partial [Burkholderiales bacterium]